MSLFDKKMKSGFYKLRDVAGETREFVVADSKGGERVFSTRVVWALDTMKRDSTANTHGVYPADVHCTFYERDLPRIPTEGEYLESPRFTKYTIIDVTIGSGVITLALQKDTIIGAR